MVVHGAEAGAAMADFDGVSYERESERERERESTQKEHTISLYLPFTQQLVSLLYVV